MKSKVKTWDCNDPKLPSHLKPVAKICLSGEQNPREKESLHDIMTKKEIKCFCKNCRRAR